MKQKTLACLLLLAAVPASAMNFLDAYNKALESDPQIRAAEYEYQSLVEAKPQARAALLPNLSASAFVTKGHSKDDVLNSDYDYDGNGYTVTLLQSVYNHAYWKSLDQADWNVKLSAANIEASRQDLILRVANAYFNILSATDSLKFARAEKEAIGQQLEQTKKRFEVGLIAITDVKETQAQYDVSVASELLSEQQLANAREALVSLINVMPDSLDILKEDMPLNGPQPANIDEWVNTAKTSNFSLKAADMGLRIAQEQVSINRSGYYPSLDLQVTYSDTNTDSENTTLVDESDTRALLQLTVPIYEGGATSSTVRSAIAKQEQARALKEQAYRETVRSSRDAYLGVTTAIAQVNALKQALISTQTAYEATEAGFQVGTRTAVEVLAAVRNQYAAERDYAQARYNYIINILKLKQAAGVLNKQDVEAVNNWLVVAPVEKEK